MQGTTMNMNTGTYKLVSDPVSNTHPINRDTVASKLVSDHNSNTETQPGVIIYSKQYPGYCCSMLTNFL